MITYFTRFTLDIPEHVALKCSHPGPCDDDVEQALLNPQVDAELSRIPASDIRNELAEYGAWDDEELSDDLANRRRILWIASSNIREELSQ